MSKTTIKVYFNNGCTTLLYNDQTTVEDIIRVVIKGRLSLNELRYKQCFQLRSTRFSQPTKDFDPLFSPASTLSSSSQSASSLPSAAAAVDPLGSSAPLPAIEDFFWLRNDLRIASWLETIKSAEKHNDIDFWKLQLRVRLISSDLNEVKFKDPVTFNYYYEQIKNDFLLYVSPSIHDVNLVPTLLELGCLEMRRAFQTMNPSILDKKINYDYLEKDVGLKRFFPELVLQQKAKSIKKMIIKGMKAYENLNEAECMLKYLERLKYLWKYNEESFKCYLGLTWSVPITVVINFDMAISWFTNTSQKEPVQNTRFEKVVQIGTELDEEGHHDGLLKLKIVDAKELLTFKFESLREAENMASLINGYCCLVNKTNDSFWVRSSLSPAKRPPSNPSVTLETAVRRSSDQEPKTPRKTDQSLTNIDDVTFRTPILNSVHILSEPDDLLSSAPASDGAAKVDTLTKKRLKHVEIGKEALSCHEKLGSGQFGDVYRGLYKSTNNQTVEVAIKKFKINHDETLDATEVAMIAKKFMKEARIMEQFDHPHIIKLIGVCSDGPLQIVMELAKFGQLRTYLQANKDEIETTTLIYYCYQLNTAMEYLESKKFVHRDIAARNVLVVNHECVKLADFGLSRQIDDNIYLATKCKLPIKWMAPESINFRKFTSLSDVWMFGVCIWEILSFGEKPFQGIKNPDVIKLIEDKQRLACPKNCPEELYFLMVKCWEYDSAMRPKFTELRYAISAIYTSYKDKTKSAIIPASSSNASSFFSTSSNSSSSVSSNQIDSNHLANAGGSGNGSPMRNKMATELLRSVMSISRNSAGAGSKTPSTSTSKNSASPESAPYLSDAASDASTTPPPKPTRLNNNNNNGGSGGALADSSTTTITPLTSIIKRAYNPPPFKSNLAANFDLNSPKAPEAAKSAASPAAAEKSDFKYLSIDKDIAYVDEDDLARNSKSADNIWLNEKLKEMGIEKQEPKRNSNQNEFSFTSTQSNSSADAAMKDILLRDQTLSFIQTISVFIRCLNNVQNIRDIDNELGQIRNSLSQLIETIKTLDNLDYHQSKRIHEKLSDLERLLLKLIQELKVNRLENVINTSLELARTANELFHTITRVPSSSPAHKS